MKLYQVDAFTSQKFSGNPAGIMLVDEFPKEEFMQNIASEMNLSETAFVKNLGNDEFDIKFFTPTEEIDLCGHASLSSAHILYSKKYVGEHKKITFHTQGGVLEIYKKETEYIMNFPLWNYKNSDNIEEAEKITHIQGIQELYTIQNDWKILVLKNKGALLSVQPDFGKMKGTDFGNIVVTCIGDDQYDYFMRCFVTDCGINEDPVTGSIECALAPFWSQKLGKTKMKSFQCSKRGGEKGIELLNDRVVISGEAITVFEIEYVE